MRYRSFSPRECLGACHNIFAVGFEKQRLYGVCDYQCSATGCAGESGSMQAVLMDFGSTREARMEINSRSEAVTLQEDAEAHCSAPYRLGYDVKIHTAHPEGSRGRPNDFLPRSASM